MRTAGERVAWDRDGEGEDASQRDCQRKDGEAESRVKIARQRTARVSWRGDRVGMVVGGFEYGVQHGYVLREIGERQLWPETVDRICSCMRDLLSVGHVMHCQLLER